MSVRSRSLLEPIAQASFERGVPTASSKQEAPKRGKLRGFEAWDIGAADHWAISVGTVAQPIARHCSAVATSQGNGVRAEADAPKHFEQRERRFYWLFGAEGAVGAGAGVGAAAGGAGGGSEGAGVGVGANCEVGAVSFLAVLHLLFLGFHWHALSTITTPHRCGSGRGPWGCKRQATN